MWTCKSVLKKVKLTQSHEGICPLMIFKSIYVITILFIGTLVGFPIRGAAVLLDLQVSELAQKLYTLDQLSESLPSFFSLPEYQKKIPLTLSQKKLLEEYRRVRKAHQKLPPHFATPALEGDSQSCHRQLFAPHPASLQDPILEAFFMRGRLEEALMQLEGIVGEEASAVLKETFDQFEPLFHRLYESSFPIMKANVERILNVMQRAQIDQHLQKLRHFYQADARAFKSVQLIWRPDTKAMSAQCYGDHLILLLPAILLEDPNAIEFIVSVLVHEATHHISGLSLDAQKSALSKAFLDKVVSSSSDHVLMLLEEPLVQATQLVFIEENYPALYGAATSWLLKGPVAAFYPLVKFYLAQGKKLDEAFITRLASQLINK